MNISDETFINCCNCRSTFYIPSSYISLYVIVSSLAMFIRNDISSLPRLLYITSLLIDKGVIDKINRMNK